MSGFDRKSGWYGLTGTKAQHWHGDRPCGCRSLEDIVQAHVTGAGFTVQPRGTWARITGPGLVDGWVSDLYLAISGQPVGQAHREPARRWRY